MKSIPTAGPQQAWAGTELFACPRCAQPVTEDVGGFRCSTCGPVGERRLEIADFSTGKDLYWSYVPREEMQRVLDLAEQEGFHAVLQKTLLQSEMRAFLLRIMDESRGDFRFLLPAERSGSVLDLGSGWGATTLALSRQFAHVVAADGTGENLRLLACRARAERRPNLDLVRIAALETTRLPFRDGTFDAVILNGVLEWLGTGSTEGSPRDHQVRLLREARRVLRPGGCVYVAIENRFFILHWLGVPEPHSGIPFVSILPRHVANLLSKIVKGRPFRNYTPSFTELKALLCEGGFQRPEFYLPLPSYQHPEVMVPLESPRQLRYWLDALLVPRHRQHRVFALGLRVLSALGVLKYLASDFSVIVRRAE